VDLVVQALVLRFSSGEPARRLFSTRSQAPRHRRRPVQRRHCQGRRTRLSSAPLAFARPSVCCPPCRWWQIEMRKTQRAKARSVAAWG